jgi:hypothetical protein
MTPSGGQCRWPLHLPLGGERAAARGEHSVKALCNRAWQLRRAVQAALQPELVARDAVQLGQQLRHAPGVPPAHNGGCPCMPQVWCPAPALRFAASPCRMLLAACQRMECCCKHCQLCWLLP